MENTKLNKEKSCPIIMKVDVAKTIRNIPHGKTIRFERDELSNKEFTVYATIKRLNKGLDKEEYAFDVDPKNGSYLISRI